MLNKFGKIIPKKYLCNILQKSVRNHCELPAIVMNNGNEMPIIGLGTSSGAGKEAVSKDNLEKIAKAVEWAIEAGYRHFDCAHVYSNQNEIGQALKKKIDNKTVAREDLFITSKLWNTFHDPKNVSEACEKILCELQLDYLDMLLMHTPMGFQYGDNFYPEKEGKILSSEVDFLDTWRAMEELVAKNLCQNIGISNFNIQQIKRLIKNCEIIPQTLQIEHHPYLMQKDLIDFAKCHDICITAYAPIGSSARVKAQNAKVILEDYKILQLAEKHQRSPAQILLRFQVQCGNAVIPKSTDRKHIVENLKIFDFELCPDDIKNIESLNHNLRYFLFEGFTGHRHHPFETTNVSDNC